MYAGNAVFSHTKVVSESKIARKMLCFTIEMGVRLCEGRRCKRAGAAMLAYVRECSDRSSIEKHCNGGVKVVLGGRFAALCIQSCKSNCNGGVKVALGGRFAALC